MVAFSFIYFLMMDIFHDCYLIASSFESDRSHGNIWYHFCVMKVMKPAIRKILVTGSSGTIGTRLCERLLAEGYEVTGVDKKKNKWNPAVQKVTKIIDLRDARKASKVLPVDVDLIIHLAANARVHDLVIDPSMAHDNVAMTTTILEHVRTQKIPRLIFSSSREVYGNAERYIHKESDISVSRCESPYTASKIADEAMVWAYQRCYGIDTIIFRFSNVYGMYDESDRLVPLFIGRARRGDDLIVYGKDKILDFTYIDDTVEGMLSGIRNFDAAKNDTYNLAYGKGISLVEVAKEMKRLMSSKSKVDIRKSRVGEVVRLRGGYF